MMIRRDALREYSRGSLWVLPSVMAAAAIVLGSVLSQISIGPSSVLAFQGTADDARSLLIDISGTMVTVIALLLGLAVVALQLSSTQYSPRLLRNFLRDRPVQVVLGFFVGTFAYGAAGLFTVGVSAGQRSDEFPRFAVTVAIVLLFVSLLGLVLRRSSGALAAGRSDHAAGRAEHPALDPGVARDRDRGTATPVLGGRDPGPRVRVRTGRAHRVAAGRGGGGRGERASAAPAR
jgi:Predicted membrane protein (DUF2254)